MWPYILLGVILIIVLWVIWASKEEKKEAVKLGLTLEEYREKCIKEKKENKYYKSQYGMSKARYIEMEKMEQECKERGIKLNDNFQKELWKKYPDLGKPTTEICFHNHKFEDKGIITRAQYFEYGWTCNSLIVWQDNKMFLLLGENNKYNKNPFPESIQKPLPFDVLISCEAVDDVTVSQGAGHSVTKTSKLGMLTRGAVGGALLGGVGALAGAMTANTTTETIFDSDKVIHNFKIYLTFNDFSFSTLTLEFGESEVQMRQVLAMLNLIIKNS